MRIPIIFLIKGRGFINQGSGLGRIKAWWALAERHLRPMFAFVVSNKSKWNDPFPYVSHAAF